MSAYRDPDAAPVAPPETISDRDPVVLYRGPHRPNLELTRSLQQRNNWEDLQFRLRELIDVFAEEAEVAPAFVIQQENFGKQVTFYTNWGPWTVIAADRFLQRAKELSYGQYMPIGIRLVVKGSSDAKSIP